MQYIQIIIYVLLSACGIVLIKLGSSVPTAISFNSGIFNFQIGFISIGGLICYVLSFLVYMNLISKHNLSYVVPISTGAVYILVFILSICIFNERVTPLTIIGSILIVVGVIFMNVKK